MSKASVVIPVYNIKNYMLNSVQSVLRQTEKDIEIIIVDDGSTDGSETVCDRIVLEDERVTVIHKKNGGLSSARNWGAAYALSDYVMFLDGDDALRIDALESLVKIAVNNNPDFIQFMYKEVIDGEGEICLPKEKITQYAVSDCKELFAKLYHYGGVAASGCTKLFKRRLIRKIPFENIQHEDEMWCTRAFQQNRKVIYYEDTLYYYYMRDNSIIHSTFNHRQLDIFKVSQERLKVLNNLSLYDLYDIEINKVFYSVLLLYIKAKNANDIYAIQVIKDVYEKYKDEFHNSKAITGKYKFILYLMSIHYSFIEFYRVYWNLKGTA